VFEPVLTVTDYYDGPRAGVALYRGAPHAYEAVFSPGEDEWSDQYRLSPISTDTLVLALEDWGIWERFERAYHAGKVEWSGNEEGWGALPDEMARRRELESLLQQQLAIDPESAIVVRGTFRARSPIEPGIPKGVMRPLEVEWLSNE